LYIFGLPASKTLNMATFYTILLLAVIGAAASFTTVFTLNIAGLVGVFVAGKPGVRSKTQFIIGSFVSALFQSYANLAYVAFVVSWSAFRINKVGVVSWLVWLFAFLAVAIPIWKTLTGARVEDKENNTGHGNPQVEALYITTLLTFIGFFVFVLTPSVMRIILGWVPYVGR
jgi:hypothetical protein